MVVLQLCSSYIHYYGKPDNVYFSLNHEPLLVSLGISNSLILYICTCIFTSIYKLHFPRACRHDEIELVILLTSVISALIWTVWVFVLIFRLATENCYMIFLILTITFFLCAPFWKCYTIESTAQLLDKWIKQVNEPLKKTINHWTIFCVKWFCLYLIIPACTY